MIVGQWLKRHRIFKLLAKALIDLRVCTGLSEALLVAYSTLLEISCHGSIIKSPKPAPNSLAHPPGDIWVMLLNVSYHKEDEYIVRHKLRSASIVS